MTIKLPMMAEIIGQPPAHSRGLQARAAIRPEDLPQAPSGRHRTELDDTLPYTLPGGRLAYIPVYEIATETVGLAGGGQELRYRVSLAAEGTDWLLRVRLLARPSPALAGRPGMATAQPLIDRASRVRLSYQVTSASGNFRRDIEFQTVIADAEGLTAVLRLSSLDEQTEVGGALTTAAALARLTVIRAATVGAEVPGVRQQVEQARARLQEATAKYELTKREWGGFLPAGLAGISVSVVMQVAFSRIHQAGIELDRAKEELTAAEKLARIEAVPLLLPQILRPDPFCLATHLYAIQVAVLHNSLATGLIRQSVEGARYYQDVARPQRFYYLPERFVLGKRSDGWPNLEIRATADTERYIVAYVAVPAVDLGRLQRHQLKLAELAASRLARPVRPEEVELEPLASDGAELKLNLPQGAGWSMVDRPGLLVDLLGAFSDAVTLSVEELRLFYDALFATNNTLFNGTITVSVGSWAQERVQLVGHLDGRPEDVWEHIFDPSIPPVFKRPIQVMANAAVFTRVSSLAVLFETGGMALLSQDGKEKTAEVGQRIEAYILRKADDGSFRYRLKWPTAEDFVIGEWRTGAGSLLLIGPEMIGG